jgi:GNAT superfamily N-acetyltransferase
VDYEIVNPNKQELSAAKKLVNHIFPVQGLLERLFFVAYAHRLNPIVKALLNLAGYRDLDTFYIAKSGTGEVLGTIGLYTMNSDAAEADWLSWFVVSPQARGQGIGNALLGYAEKAAIARGKRVLRLYTGSGEIMAKAQGVYEKAGYRIYKTKAYPGFTVIYREKRLVTAKTANHSLVPRSLLLSS